MKTQPCWRGWRYMFAAGVGLAFGFDADAANRIAFEGGAESQASFSYLDCQGQPEMKSREDGSSSRYVEVGVEARVDEGWTPRCNGNLGSATAIQTPGGISALRVEFSKYQQLASPIFSANTHYLLVLSNYDVVPLPVNIHFSINPGFIRLSDSTTNGIGPDGQTGLAQFNIVSDRFFPGHLQEKWTWVQTLSGGRLGVTNSSSGFDPQGLGFPVVSTNYSSDTFEAAYLGIDAVLALDAILPGEQVLVTYTIIVQATGDGSFRGQDNGVIIQAGDPVQVESGHFSASGSQVLAVAGDVVFGSPKLVPVLQPGLVGDKFGFTFNAASNQTYAVDYRSSFAGNNLWQVLTNYAALPAPALRAFTNQISSSEGYYRVRTP